MEQYIRNYQYIQDYYQTVYNLYSKDFIGYPVNYYKLDLENSVYDDEKTEGGSYEKFGVGSWSGYKWNKILFFPVYGIDQIQPRMSASEKGLNLSDSETTKITFPSFYFKPSENDIIHFHQDFMYERKINVEPLFVVIGTHPVTYGDITHWQCDLKILPSSRNDLEKQVNNTYMFLEINKNIYDVENALFLLRLQKKNEMLKDRMENYFDNNIGVYLV